MSEFEFSHGSVRGKTHVMNQHNNQDAYTLRVTPDVTAAVVCDGCSKGKFSEVGALLGSRILANILVEEYPRLIFCPDWGTEAVNTSNWWALVRAKFLARLGSVLYDIDSSITQSINDFFLFTTMAAVIDKDMALFASIGDGVIIVNGEVIQVGPFPENQPPYVFYVLSPRKNISTEILDFQVHKAIPASNLQNFLMGCDGVKDLMDVGSENIPGTQDKVGPISQFWEENRYFKNPFLLSGKLTMINGGVFRVEKETLICRNGLLLDDTTLIVGRRKESE